MAKKKTSTKKKTASVKRKASVERGFGRLVSPDKRDKKFPMSRIAAEAPVGRKVWAGSWLGDQGATPRCVGFAWAHWLNSQPIRQFIDPGGIYSYAQHVDEWKDEDYEGTSVRAGAKVLQDMGFIESYHWGFNEEDVIRCVLTVGPVVIGSHWKEGMMEVDEKGFIHPTGSVMGGHAWLITGCDTRKGFYILKNSWGPSWGRRQYPGTALLKMGDLAQLIQVNGEACIGVERKAQPCAKVR